MWYFASVPRNGNVGALSGVSVRAVKLPGTVTSGGVAAFGFRVGDAPRLAEQAESRSASTATNATARSGGRGPSRRCPAADAGAMRSGPLLMGPLPSAGWGAVRAGRAAIG